MGQISRNTMGCKKQYVDESDFKTDVCLMNPAKSATKNYSS